MKHAVKGLLILLIFSVTAFTGCKLDPPIIPGYAKGEIKYTADGNNTTINKNVTFDIATDEDFPNGGITIVGGAGVSDQFSIIAEGKGTGSFPIGLIIIGNYAGSAGTMVVTKNDGKNLEGTFTSTDLTDLAGGGTYQQVNGTFKISKN